MTNQSRIEKAARAFVVAEGMVWGQMTEQQREDAREVGKCILSAAYPELASDPPTHWVAPMEVTETMLMALGPMRREGQSDDAWGVVHYARRSLARYRC